MLCASSLCVCDLDSCTTSLSLSLSRFVPHQPSVCVPLVVGKVSRFKTPEFAAAGMGGAFEGCEVI